jgi:hypothetical protein
MTTERKEDAIIDALTRILSDQYGRTIAITGFLRRSLHHENVSRLFLELDGRVQTTLIMKRYPREARPGLPLNYCEGMTGRFPAKDLIAAQEAILGVLSGSGAAPELYGTICDTEKHHYWLFMEDLGEPLRTVREDFENEEMKHCLGFIETLAKIHRLFVGKEETLLKVVEVLLHTPRSPEGWRDRYRAAIEQTPGYLETFVDKEEFSWLAEIGPPFIAVLSPCCPMIDKLVSQPFVFNQWDKAPEENFVIGREGDEPVYCFIDWDEIYFGPALDDLCGLIWYERPKAEQLVLAEHYWHCNKDTVLVPSDKKAYLHMYKQYRLMHAVWLASYHLERSIKNRHISSWGAKRLKHTMLAAIRLAEEIL